MSINEVFGYTDVIVHGESRLGINPNTCNPPLAKGKFLKQINKDFWTLVMGSPHSKDWLPKPTIKSQIDLVRNSIIKTISNNRSL